MLALVAVAAALVDACDAVDHGKFTQAGAVAQWRKVGLSDRSSDSKLYILIHNVDKLSSVDYIMLHGVTDFNHWRLHFDLSKALSAAFILLIHTMEHIVTKKVSPIPRGYRTATTCLTVFDIDSAVAFYQAAFGAELLTRHCGASDTVALHATIKIGNSIIALNREAPEQGLLTPASLGVCSNQVHLYLDNVGTSWERAIEAGAQVHTPLYDAYWGDRTGMLVDGNGYLWSMASKIENLSQEEIARRARAWYQVDMEIPEEVEVPVAAMMAEETLADAHVAV